MLMKTSIYDFSDYKAYILYQIQAADNEGRGVRRKLGEFIGCQVAYVSHVLAGHKHFSLEQAEASARYFGLNEEEKEFLLMLVEHQKAGTTELKRHLAKRLDAKKSEYREIKNKISIQDEITPEDQAEYYSSWHFQAVHSLMSVPGFQTAGSIAERLVLPLERVNEILRFLREKGMATLDAGEYSPTAKYIHLPRTSPLISKLHGNWRIRTLASLDRLRDEDFHYSGLVTLSKADVDRVREILLNALSASVDVVRPSKEETVALLAMDFYEL
ncbi:MAG: TIGR02147 family protein [Proteobacteria bacterium]|nr:MAG: TIGR02147 family protein [Pseudomonadota bacterium]